MFPPDPAEQRLLDLGITEPDEIDVEVIAHLEGAMIRYRPLPLGDARILGVGDRAIITVDAGASPVRQRFSIAHELGHWHYHRGQQLACHAVAHIDAVGDHGAEREADRYAASLLMPRFMIMPVVGSAPMSMALGHRIAERFRVSMLAAMLRLVDLHSGAFTIVIEQADGRRWFKRSRALDPRLLIWLPGPARRGARNGRTCLAVDWYRGDGLGACIATYEARRMPDGSTIHLIGAPT